MKKVILLILFYLSTYYVGAYAQDSISLDDSLAFMQMRIKMDKIRRHRPTVALVLSGGGAKGVAHVGVIKYLLEKKIPVDLVVGTSMGALVGSLFSLGYTAYQMEDLMTNMDWKFYMSDKVPRNYIPYQDKLYKEKYILSFPFYYEDSVLSSNNRTNRYKKLRINADDNDINQGLKEKILNSLPSGFVNGYNFSNLSSSLTVAYQDSIDFFELPIPFMCVATELISGKAKYWHSGKLNVALRSTMSLPGIFTPVKYKGMVLLDGGARDNYPCKIAKDLGADIVIGVDLSGGYKDFDKLNNLMDIFVQGMSMLGRGQYEQSLKYAVISIHPNLHGYNLMDFDKQNVQNMMHLGYLAAEEREKDIDSIKNIIGDYSTNLYNLRAKDIAHTKVLIDDIDILGVSEKEKFRLLSELEFNFNRPIGKNDIEEAVTKIYANRSFEYVTYELLGHKEPYKLVITCKKGPINQLGFSVRYDTEEVVSMLLNLGIGTKKSQGNAIDLTAKIGINPYATFHYYHNTSFGLTLNSAMNIKWVDRNQYSIGESSYNISYFNQSWENYISNISWQSLDIKAGFRQEYYRLHNIMATNVIGDYNIYDLTNFYLFTFMRANVDSFDNRFFPHSGFSLFVDYSFGSPIRNNDINYFHTLQLQFKSIVTLNKKFAILPSINTRFLFGGKIPLPYINTIGGNMEGRYLRQQIPFYGIIKSYTTNKFLFVSRIDFRYQLSENNYVSAIFNYAHSLSGLNYELIEEGAKDIFGIGAEYSYNSVIGPIKANIYWSNVSHRLAGYIGIGFDF